MTHFNGMRWCLCFVLFFPSIFIMPTHHLLDSGPVTRLASLVEHQWTSWSAGKGCDLSVGVWRSCFACGRLRLNSRDYCRNPFYRETYEETKKQYVGERLLLPIKIIHSVFSSKLAVLFWIARAGNHVDHATFTCKDETLTYVKKNKKQNPTTTMYLA